MSASCDVIGIFSIYGQFGAIQKPDSERIVCKTYISIKSNLLSYKKLKTEPKKFNTTLTLLLWVKVLFLSRNADFLSLNQEGLGANRYIFWN